MDTGPEFLLRHVLADGTHVLVRHIQASDREALRDAFLRLSPESRYRRFFAAISELDDRTLDYLCNVDGNDHVALVAFVESPDLKVERGVGVVRFIRVPSERHVAEIAVTVADDYQRRGIGTLLLLTAIRAARERGVTHFRGEVLAQNTQVIEGLEQSGATLRSEDGTKIFDLAIAPEPPLLKLLGIAARQLNVFLRKFLP